MTYAQASLLGVTYLEHGEPIASYDIAALRAHAQALNGHAPTIGCVTFPALDDFDNVLIIFAGNMERFFMLSVARFARCKVVYFQDSASFWYQGSVLLPKLTDLGPFLAAQTEGLRPVIFGQSSGGYAALLASTHFEGAQAVACSPQTFCDKYFKARIHFSPKLNPQIAPDDLIDLKDYLPGRTSRNELTIITAACELNNPYGSHFWVDHAHAFRMVDVENLRIFMVAGSNHSLVFRRSMGFARLLEGLLGAASAPAEARLGIIGSFAAGIDEANTEKDWI
ncbi:hypothetical protein [Ensifer soli]|uniref:hypothetical protein n=1 Tax=Ciceribacter sp. sgz301302 TaxID=3342379 RepID=UPI0035B7986E